VVTGYLRQRDLLLILDNCEHLLPASAELVGTIITAAPGVRVIATSREPLSVPGEHVVPIPPLALPPPAGEPGEPRRSEAVRLFAERAAAASGSFEVTSRNEGVVAELCRRLDGLPLAIELAAVRTRMLSAEQILSRLTDRFALLTGGGRAALPRHQTLRATIEWSHGLLPDAERVILRRLGVFAGRFTLEDVEAVCAAAGVPAATTLDTLGSLVDKSLVTKDEANGAAWYRLHETMREFAALMLSQAGEQDAAEARCAEYFLRRSLAAALDSRYQLPDWLAWADLEIDNLRAVLRWYAARGQAGPGAGLAASLGWYWITRATTEGTQWLDEFLAGHDNGPAELGWARFMRGFLALLKNDPDAASPALRAAMATASRTGQRELLAEASAMASAAETARGDHAAAGQLIQAARAAGDGLDYPAGQLALLQAQALHGFAAGDLATVRAVATEGAELARAGGDLYALEMMTLNLGSAGLIAGDLDAARPALTEALRVAREIDDRVSQVYLLIALAYHAARSRQASRAARLLGAADEARAASGITLLPQFAPLVPAASEEAVAALGAPRFEAEVASGRELARAEAVRLALGEPASASPDAQGDAGPSPLSRREAEIAALIAGGLTNKQIGTRLFLSERTIDSHVRSILTKLGASTRAQIAAWVTAGGH
jgi:predicted ATPase/DNA-binding CsgD family transcriptional regulator